MIDTNAVLGYAWPLVVSPGEEVAFHLSSPSLTAADAMVVRVRCADPDPAGPGLKMHEPGSALDGTLALREQKLHPGSCAVIPNSPALTGFAGFTAGAFVWPTLPGERAQTILARWQETTQEGWRLGLDEAGHVEFVIGHQGRIWRAISPLPLQTREWAVIAGVWDPAAATIRVMVRSLDPQGGRDRGGIAEAEGPAALAWPDAVPLTFAAHSSPALACYDGKIDRPRLYAAPLSLDALHHLCEAYRPAPGDPALIGAWDFSQGIPTSCITDLSANRLDGTLVQMPTRAMTGANWNSSTERWTEAPEQYGAIHFHSDDMHDAGWQEDVRFTVPADWRSGFYALRLRARQGEENPVESFV